MDARPTAPDDILHRLELLEADVASLRQGAGAVPPAAHGALVEILLRDNARRRDAEQALAEAQAWIQLAQEAGGVAAYHFDLTANDLAWSASTFKLYGWAPSSRNATLDNWLSAVHPEDRAAVAAVAQAALAHGSPIHHEFRIVWPDGTIRWIQDRGRVLLDAQGRPQRVVGLNIDITDLKRTQEALAESEERFRFTFENAAVGVAHVALDGRFLDANPWLCEFLGMPREALVGRTFAEITHPDDLASDLRQVARLVAGEIDRFTLEKRYVRPDGTAVWADLNVALQRDAAGRPLNFISVVTDIRSRKHTEEQLTFGMGELAHRSKNLLTVIQSIVRMTARRATDIADFQEALQDRLMGIAMAQELLLRHPVEGTPLADLLRMQLSAFLEVEDQRVDLAGPDLRLTAAATQTLGLAFHELATNACKHGALSSAEGRVTVTWDLVTAAEGQRIVAIEWREAGGPSVSAPARSGFGRRVIETMVRASLQAEVALLFDASGLRWVARLPTGCLEPDGAAG